MESDRIVSKKKKNLKSHKKVSFCIKISPSSFKKKNEDSKPIENWLQVQRKTSEKCTPKKE